MDADRLRGIIGSVVVHLVVIGVLGFTLWDKPTPRAVAVSAPIIQARAVDEATALAPVRRREAEEQRKRDVVAQKKREAEAENRRQLEAKRQKVEAEQKKLELEKKRQLDLKNKQLALEKKAQLDLKQRREEAEKKRLAEEQKKREEALKKQQEDEIKRKQREEKLKQEIAAEDARLREDERRLNAQRMSGMVNQYLSDITNRVQANWLRLPGMPQNFQCKVEVRQIPGGEVVGVRMIESSGDAALDRSVEAAVWKSSPLPTPPSAELFDREVVITFVPK